MLKTPEETTMLVSKIREHLLKFRVHTPHPRQSFQLPGKESTVIQPTLQIRSLKLREAPRPGLSTEPAWASLALPDS